MEGRTVIAHVSELYGAEAVSQTYLGTMAAKAVVRTWPECSKPYGLADKLSKLIPFEVGMTLNKAMEDSEDLRAFVNENDEAGDHGYGIQVRGCCAQCRSPRRRWLLRRHHSLTSCRFTRKKRLRPSVQVRQGRCGAGRSC